MWASTEQRVRLLIMHHITVFSIKASVCRIIRPSSLNLVDSSAVVPISPADNVAVGQADGSIIPRLCPGAMHPDKKFYTFTRRTRFAGGA